MPVTNANYCFGPIVDPTARWFDVFRDWAEPLRRRGLDMPSLPRRRLLHVAAVERRRWKRRQWLRSLYAL
jgi:hypothetical protein